MRKLNNNKIGRNRIKELIKDFVVNRVNDIDSLALKYKMSRTQISTIIDDYINKNQFFIVVPSLDLSNTFFVFNGINERKFTVDCAGFIQERYYFNTKERQHLKYLGFNI